MTADPADPNSTNGPACPNRPDPPACECPAPGHCQRHGREMTPRLWQLCQTSAEYRRAFARGKSRRADEQAAAAARAAAAAAAGPPRPPNGPPRTIADLIRLARGEGVGGDQARPLDATAVAATTTTNAPGDLPVLDCVHRGPIARTEDCQLCGARGKRAAVYYCRVRGECTQQSAGLRRLPPLVTLPDTDPTADPTADTPASTNASPSPLGELLPVCSTCPHRLPHTQRRVVVRDPLPLGDQVVLAAAVAELQEQFSGRFLVEVQTLHPSLYDGPQWQALSVTATQWTGPAAAANRNANPSGARHPTHPDHDRTVPSGQLLPPIEIDATYSPDSQRDTVRPSPDQPQSGGPQGQGGWHGGNWGTINASGQRPIHQLHATCEGLANALQLERPLLPRDWLRPVIRLTEDERGWFPQWHGRWPAEFDDLPVWLFNGGCKNDYPAKFWGFQQWQKLIDLTKNHVNWVQVGRKSADFHPTYDGVALDLLDQTDTRQLIRAVYWADGVACGVTGLMHLAAWVDQPLPGARKHQRHPRRQCVVVAGGRESPHWFSYPGHQVYHTIGRWGCCARGGCWKARATPPEAGPGPRAGEACERPVALGSETLPECMVAITPEAVAAQIIALYD
jgi:hypothetical protein